MITQDSDLSVGIVVGVEFFLKGSVLEVLFVK
jgi:hypothetical protein